MAKRAKSLDMRLEAMALEIPEFPDHPNRVPFSGVLTRVNVPSDRAPNGAAGHRVLLPRDVAERALPSLLGMAVDYAPGLRGHDVSRKIGVISRAEIREDRLEVAGYLFGKDFPEVLADLRARRERLGMSYEVTGVRVADPSAEIWVLERVVFTGAAILERNAAAYQSTSLAATAAGSRQGENMNDRIAQALDMLAQTNRALTAEFANLRSLLDELRQSQAAVTQIVGQGGAVQAGHGDLETRVEALTNTSEELRRQNQALHEQAERFAVQASRKTVSPQVLTLLAKSGVGSDVIGPGGRIEVPVLDRALESLSLEQRIAVKAQLARAGALD